jgi:uncharacterized membrane protein YfcA
MDPTFVVEAATIGLIVGFAVGATGIGGIMLVPFLNLALGLDIQRAIAATLMSYIPSGALAAWLYARRGSVDWRRALALTAAATPAAFLGALATGWAPAGLLELMIGAIMLMGGIHGLWPRAAAAAEARLPGTAMLALLGAVTGFLAAMTGAGGALILLPVLMLLEAPVLPAIGLCQTIALPIAVVASFANLGHGQLDLDVALLLAAALAAGIAIGTPVAHALPQALLKRSLSVMIAVLGALMLLRLASRTGLLG